MEIITLIFGALAALVGGAVLWDGVRRGRGIPFLNRLLVLSFGVAFTVYGGLILAQGLGLPWATPRLRGKLYLWLAIPCAVAWIAVWFSERRGHRR
jgi:hypothetical protein